MKIETKLNLRDKCYFLMHGKVRESRIQAIDILINESGNHSYYHVDNNPAGGQYTTRFSDNDIFNSKEDLLKSL